MSTVAPETTRVESLDWVVIPSIVLLSLTIAGALMILGSMAWLEYRGRPSTTRTRLVQALVLSDLVLGIVGLIGNAMEISPGHRLKAGTATCDGLGFMLIAVLWTEHVWTLCLALGTYLILIHPLHTLTLILEKHWIWLWGLVWVSAIVIATITQTLYGFKPSGGICYYPQSAGLYGELMQFIPRAVVFICITILYARLYVFLKRPDKIRSPYSNSPTGASYDSTYAKRKAAGFIRKLSGGEKGSPAEPNDVGAGEGNPAITVEKDHQGNQPTGTSTPPDPPFNRDNRPSMNNSRIGSTGFGDTTFRPPSAPVSPTTEIPPWERLELPVFQVDGQRYGGPSASTSQGQGQGMFGTWKGMGSSKKRPSTANSTGSNPTSPGLGPVAMPFPPYQPGSTNQGYTHPSGRSPGSYPNGVGTGTGNGARSSDGTNTGSGTGHVGNRSRNPSSDTTLVNGVNDKERERKMSMMTNHTANSTSAASTNNTHNTNYSNYYFANASRRPSAAPPHASPVMEQEEATRSREDDRGLGLDEERGSDDEDEEEDEEDNEMDLLRMLAQDSEPEDQNPGQKEEYELVPESMASYLNRKTALLMLWFPLGYVALFSISLIRVIYDFAGQPPTVLRAMSRWFVFAQGVLDAVIYGWVEWHTKRVVRRKLRKGALSPGGSRGSASFGVGSGNGMGSRGINSALKAMSVSFGRSKNGTGTGTGTATGSRIGTQSQSQTRSRGQTQGQGQTSSILQVPGQGQYPSIMQELEMDMAMAADNSRKGSWATSDGKSKVEGSEVSDTRA